ncbi:MAG: oxidoreductase, partial [Acidobacteria bacterium]
MRAVLEDMKSGEVMTCDVPAPELRPSGILVRTHFSAISSGTERAKVQMGEQSLLQKARSRPELVKQVLDYARTNGVRAAYQKVQSRLNSLSPMGYSSAGVVLEVGEGVDEFQPGDRVACAGGGYASHCEINFVPRNLAAKVPNSVPLDAASLTTIGAIAMQGLRQAKLSFGDNVVIIGAGLVGILTVQIARAAGCRVIAVDIDRDRAGRAAAMGAHLGIAVGDPQLPMAVQEFSRYGPDAAIITAATSSTEPLELAAQLVRDRGRIVVVGDVGMGVSRTNIYHKEISIVMSRSYGPGRYDPQYEEQGQDYPIGYVRWTEKRNMEAFLELLASGSLNVAPLLEAKYPVENACAGYAHISKSKAYTAIIEYANATDPPRPVSAKRLRSGDLRIGCIGAGGFARSIIFPNLRGARGVGLESVATSSGVAAESARRSFGFALAQTPDQLLANKDVNAIFIISRHDSHADLVVRALANEKAVFVEKPLATNRQQLAEIQRAYHEQQDRAPFVMVGFNRRFAPATEEIRQFFVGHHEPMMVQIRVNAGHIPHSHWVHEAGGRIVGELCHFVDLARALVGVPIRSVSAAALPDGARYSRDNVAVTLTFTDGSIATLAYLSNGERSLPKEHVEVFCEGSVARLHDFTLLELVRNGRTRRLKCHHDK